MTADQVRETLRAQPFKPFRLVLTDGTGVDISHPDFLLLAQNGRTAAAAVGEVIKILDVALITAIEIGVGNGKRAN